MNDVAARDSAAKGFKWVGTRPIRPDGVPKVTGTALYGSDMVMPGMLVGSVLIAWILLRYSNTGAVPVGALPGPPRTIADLLFHDFLLPFEVTSVLVLIAIMGAVVLATREDTPTPGERGRV